DASIPSIPIDNRRFQMSWIFRESHIQIAVRNPRCILGVFGQPDRVSYQSEKKQLAEELRRALSAMDAWTPSRCVEYEITLGIVDRKTAFTTDFGGEATPEPDSVAWLRAPNSASLPLIRLLYL